MNPRQWSCVLAMIVTPAAAGAQPYAFVSNTAAESVAVVDLAQDAVVATLPLAGRPTGAALSRDGSRLFVAQTQLDSLAIIDTATGAVTSIPVGAAPTAVAPGRRRAYVANTGDDSVSVIDMATGVVVATIPVGDAPSGVVAAGSHVYVANWGGNSVSVVDALSNIVVDTMEVGTFPTSLALHRRRLYVASFADDTVSVIDAPTRARITTVPVGRRPRGLALDPVAGRLYVASFEDARIDVIDTATNTVVLRAPSGGLNPTDLMLGPGGLRLYVSHLEAGQPLRVLDAATLAPLTAIDAPAGPVSLAGYGEHAPPASAGESRLGSALDGLLSFRGRSAAVRQRAPERLSTPTDVVIFDGEFNLADWSVFIANGSSITTRETAGGNPGAWRNTVHTAGPQPVETWHQFLGASYDPQSQGAIATIDVSWDRKVAGETPVSESVVVVQDGHPYRTAVSQQFSTQVWASAGYPQLTQGSFSDDQGNQPDFSAGGAPLVFGYYRRTPQGGTGGHGIDNFRVVVHTAPSAGALAFEKSLELADTDTAIVTVERLGGMLGAVGATLRVAHPNGDVTDGTVSWSDGDQAPKQVGVLLHLVEQNRAQTGRISLVKPTGGASIAQGRGKMAIVHAPPGWPPELLAMFLSFEVLLAAFSPEWLLALAVAAVLVARRSVRRRVLVALAAAVLLVTSAGCVPEAEVVYSPVGFNQKLRPDRVPLDAAQTQALVSKQRFGPYRVGTAELASPLVPAAEQASRITQSDCWWMAQGAQGGGDAVRARWEAVVELGGGVPDVWEDPEDHRLDVGLCRINDPETRNPPQSREGEEPSMDLDCSRMGERAVLTLNEEAAFPRCTTDTAFLGVRLEAYASTVTDTYQRCDVLLPRFTRFDRTIGMGTDFFDGASAGAGEQARVAACTADLGNHLIPPSATRYRLSLSDHVEQWLEPVLLPIQAGASLGRRLALANGNWSWATRVTSVAGSTATRWQENFSPSLRVRTVAVFEPAGPTGRRYVNPSPPPTLCIEDRDVVDSGCRWTCDDASADNVLSYDLFAPLKCRNSQGQWEVPSVNPTAAPVNLLQFAQKTPVRWRVDAGALPQPALWIEFTLATTLAPAGLTASPPLIDLGGARVGESTRGAFVVRNSGAHPMRVTAVAMSPAGPGSPHSADFAPQLPYAPAPVPLPVEVVSTTTTETTLLARADEREVLYRLYRDSVMARLAPRGQGFSETIDGHVVTEQDGLLRRDAPNARFNHDVARQPLVRMTYASRTLPFTVQPGETFEVSVRGTPSATGDRVAEVRVSAVSVLDPARQVEVRVLAKLFGLQGPLLSVAPGVIAISADHGAGQEIVRTVLVQNAGDVAGVLGVPLLTGPGGGALPAASPFTLEDPYASWSTLGVGEYREVRLHFVSACGATPGTREDAAEVRWATADGPIVVPVYGTTRCGP